MEWQSKIKAEFTKAEQARAHGNEGQARVCARRAAGLAAREYFARLGEPIHTSSAYDLLNLLAGDIRLSAETRQAASYLTLRVDDQFKLPVDVDLITEANKLVNVLAAPSRID